MAHIWNESYSLILYVFVWERGEKKREKKERERESVCVRVCVCERESEREKEERGRGSTRPLSSMCVCVCVCVCVRARARVRACSLNTFLINTECIAQENLQIPHIHTLHVDAHSLFIQNVFFIMNVLCSLADKSNWFAPEILQILHVRIHNIHAHTCTCAHMRTRAYTTSLVIWNSGRIDSPHTHAHRHSPPQTQTQIDAHELTCVRTLSQRRTHTQKKKDLQLRFGKARRGTWKSCRSSPRVNWSELQCVSHVATQPKRA